MLVYDPTQFDVCDSNGAKIVAVASKLMPQEAVQIWILARSTRAKLRGTCAHALSQYPTFGPCLEDAVRVTRPIDAVTRPGHVWQAKGAHQSCSCALDLFI